MRRALALALTVALTSCTTTPDNPSANPEAVAPLICPSKPVCDTYWQRAQAWVASNSAWKIQTASDAIIQTYGPAYSRVDLAYTITRVPNADGSARIVIAANCDNFIRCYPTRTDAIVSFKRFVRQ